MSLFFYGERGLVNGIVLDLIDNIDLIKTFLRSINFCDSYNPLWIEKDPFGGINSIRYAPKALVKTFGFKGKLNWNR